MWDKLKKTSKPIVLYGTGNAAEKIIAELNNRDIPIAGIFASDGFVRSRSFAGFPVISYSEAKKQFGEMVVLLCFGSHRADVLDNIKKIDSEQELYAPDLPIAGEGLFSCNDTDVENICLLLADEKSRQVLRNVIEYKRSGKIRYLLDCETDDNENWELLNINDHENYLDLGAYTGDTVSQFLMLSGNKYASIAAVEPEKRNFRKLSESCGELSCIELINKAIGLNKGLIEFSKNQGRGSLISTNQSRHYTVEMDCVDSICEGREISLIKMDLEGAEQEAIQGARETIKKNRPKMLISAYHRNDDLFVIPKMVRAINPEYKIYLRKSPCLPAWEVNYYFV